MAYIMSADERSDRERTKLVHAALRCAVREGIDGRARRHALLAWAFVRGLKYRRCERSTRTQKCGEVVVHHNLPSESLVWAELVLAGAAPKPPGELPKEWWRWANAWRTTGQGSGEIGRRIEAWLADPSGAIAAPPPRPKKPFARVAA